MLNKYSTIVLGAMLGLGTLAFTSAGASAAAMLPLLPIASGEANAANDGTVQVTHKENWQNKHINNKCLYNNDGCHIKNRNTHRYKHRRDRFDRSDLFLPLIIGGGFGGYNYYNNYDDYDDYFDYDGGGLSSRHVRYCLKKYKSYRPRNNTWVTYSGKVKKCYSPYL